MHRFLFGLLASVMVMAPAWSQTPPPSSATIGAAEDDSGLVAIASKHSVGMTTDRLVQGINNQGLYLFARIDHRAGAEKVKLALRPTELLIFGSPKLGTLLMHQNQTIGLDLPLKFLVWQTGSGEVFIAWNNPYYLAKRYGVPENFEPLAQISQTLSKLATAAAR
jgi:uncharacterized protein (DUF302 family)